MDRPNEGESNSRRMSWVERSRNLQADMEERRHKAIANRAQYQPQIHEQIQRLFSEYEAPFYARIRGAGRSQNLALAEATVLLVAAGTDKNFSDTETQALTEHYLSSIHNKLAWKWFMTGLAGYMTYRGRRTMRFPIFQPNVTGRLNPDTGGPQVRIMWHTARFAAYYGVLWLLAEPLFEGVNFIRQTSSLDRDPRLASLRKGRQQREQAGIASGAAQASNGQQYGETRTPAAQQDDYSSSPNDSYQSISQAVQSQTQQTWNSYRQSQASNQPSSKGWDTGEDFDDASPVAPPPQSENEDPRAFGVSSWDRIRQQSYSSTKQERVQDQKTWEGTQSNTDGWGSNGDTSPQWRGGINNSSSSSSIDRDKDSARKQAQKEFEDLLERERKGADEERDSWNRR